MLRLFRRGINRCHSCRLQFERPVIANNYVRHVHHDTGILHSDRELIAAQAKTLTTLGTLVASDAALAEQIAARLPVETMAKIEGVISHAQTFETKDESNISWKEYYLVMLSRGIPFIGFGIMDNAIMIIAGDYIDHHLGVAFAISTMAAAALGNLCSDVCGVGLGGVIEGITYKMGVPAPSLTASQWQLPKVKWATMLGSALGVSIGCIIGMFPLMFTDDAHKKKEADQVDSS